MSAHEGPAVKKRLRYFWQDWIRAIAVNCVVVVHSIWQAMVAVDIWAEARKSDDDPTKVPHATEMIQQCVGTIKVLI